MIYGTVLAKSPMPQARGRPCQMTRRSVLIPLVSVASEGMCAWLLICVAIALRRDNELCAWLPARLHFPRSDLQEASRPRRHLQPIPGPAVLWRQGPRILPLSGWPRTRQTPARGSPTAAVALASTHW